MVSSELEHNRTEGKVMITDAGNTEKMTAAGETEEMRGQWLEEQRAAYWAGLLSASEIEQLESLPEWTWGEDTTEPLYAYMTGKEALPTLGIGHIVPSVDSNAPKEDQPMISLSYSADWDLMVTPYDYIENGITSYGLKKLAKDYWGLFRISVSISDTYRLRDLAKLKHLNGITWQEVRDNCLSFGIDPEQLRYATDSIGVEQWNRIDMWVDGTWRIVATVKDGVLHTSDTLDHWHESIISSSDGAEAYTIIIETLRRHLAQILRGFVPVQDLETVRNDFALERSKWQQCERDFHKTINDLHLNKAHLKAQIAGLNDEIKALSSSEVINRLNKAEEEALVMMEDAEAEKVKSKEAEHKARLALEDARKAHERSFAKLRDVQRHNRQLATKLRKHGIQFNSVNGHGDTHHSKAA